jgi:hypothetical protein
MIDDLYNAVIYNREKKQECFEITFCLLKVIKKTHMQKTLLRLLLFNAARVTIRVTTSDFPGGVSGACWSKAFVPNPIFVIFRPKRYEWCKKKKNK